MIITSPRAEAIPRLSERPKVNSSGRMWMTLTGYCRAMAVVASVEPESTRMIYGSFTVCCRMPVRRRPICFSSLLARITIEQRGPAAGSSPVMVAFVTELDQQVAGYIFEELLVIQAELRAPSPGFAA